MDEIDGDLKDEVTKMLRRIVDAAPTNGNSMPHPSEYWAGVIAARSLLARIETKSG